MARAKTPDPEAYTPFGKRLHFAAETEGTSVTALGREHDFGPALHRYCTGARGNDTFTAIERLLAIAKKLHVNFEWLVIGTGPMRRGGREQTPAEQAIVFARKAGAREDAIEAAWEENKDKETTWDAWQWTEAIDGHVRRLERAGTPRPERVRAMQRDFAKVAKKIAKSKAEKQAEAAARDAAEKAAAQTPEDTAKAKPRIA